MGGNGITRILVMIVLTGLVVKRTITGFPTDFVVLSTWLSFLSLVCTGLTITMVKLSIKQVRDER